MRAPWLLSEVFCSHGGIPSEPSEELEQALGALLRACQTTWPEVSLAHPIFVKCLAEHLPEGDAPLSGLARLHGTDLYLACACQDGLPEALAAFDRAILSQVPAFVSRIDSAPDFADEVRQRLRQKLLLGRPGGRPKIAEYAGKAPLWSWVRVVAVREALNLRKRGSAQPFKDVDDIAALAEQVRQDPELELIRVRYQKEFKEALREAFARLPQQQRGVMRLYYAAQLTGDQIAAMMKVNRTTVVRWLVAARKAVLHDVRRLLHEKLRLSASEFEGLIQAMQSRLDASLSELLQTSPP